MKMKNFLLMLLCIIGSHLYTQAQITLTDSNMTISPHTETRYLDTINIPIPMEGENMVYDYSNLAGEISTTSEFFAATRDGFTDYTSFNLMTEFVSGMSIYTERYRHLDADGLALTAFYKLDEVLPLVSVTGNANDEAVFLASGEIYEPPVYILKFPTTYGSTWTRSYTRQTDFELTVTAFGLASTPGYSKEYREDTGTVVGWGELTIPTETGVSIPYDVLMVKREATIVDSLFLAGAPAPDALVAAFGLVQGATTITNQYNFYAEGFERPLLSINMSDDWTTVEGSDYGTNDVTTGTKENLVSSSAITIFPNPTTDIAQLSIENHWKGELSLRVLNALGQTVHRASFEKNGDKATYNLDASSFANGTYHILLSDGKEMSVQSFTVIR